MKLVNLSDVALAQSGRARGTCTVGVLARRLGDFNLVERQLTVNVVLRMVYPAGWGVAHRYVSPTLGGLNFVLHRAADDDEGLSGVADSDARSLSALFHASQLWVAGDWQPVWMRGQ